MADALSGIDDVWPTEDGWPYADADRDDDALDVGAELDDDLVSLHALTPHLLDSLTPLQRRVLSARFGLDGAPVVSMKQLQHELGLPRADLRTALGDGLAAVRAQLA